MLTANACGSGVASNASAPTSLSYSGVTVAAQPTSTAPPTIVGNRTSGLHWHFSKLSGAVGPLTCISAKVCIASDSMGIMWWTSNATSESPTWTEATTFPLEAPLALACPSASMCLAGTNDGAVRWSNTPESSFADWDHITLLNSLDYQAADDGYYIDAVSCPSTNFCLVLDESGAVFSSTDPATASWQHLTQEQPVPVANYDLDFISCPTSSECAAVNDAGYGVYDVTTNSWTSAPATWQGTYNGNGFTSLTCPTVHLCLATFDGALVLGSAIPGSGWVIHIENPPMLSNNNPSFQTVTCISSHLCVAIGANSFSDPGTGFMVTDDPAGPVSAWRMAQPKLPAQSGMTAVGCSLEGTCAVAAGDWVATLSLPMSGLPGGLGPSTTPTLPPAAAPTGTTPEQHTAYEQARSDWEQGASQPQEQWVKYWNEAYTVLQRANFSDMSSMQAVDSLQQLALGLPLNPTLAAPMIVKYAGIVDSYFSTPRLYGG